MLNPQHHGLDILSRRCDTLILQPKILLQILVSMHDASSVQHCPIANCYEIATKLLRNISKSHGPWRIITSQPQTSTNSVGLIMSCFPRNPTVYSIISYIKLYTHICVPQLINTCEYIHDHTCVFSP